ncbi:hypothetical protein ACO2Q3_07700 [Caulobacter sp. KR2-114]|uniref:hypothetical protein n=1 Tax=Caulobacter sp. KR2-114 TaxID=3400912 RepID=UPI003C0CD271
MGALALEGLTVLVTGVEASLSRDLVRVFSGLGATVMAADADTRKLQRLERDVALYRARIEAAPINLASSSELRLFEDNLRLLGRLPHVMICCCPAHNAGAQRDAKGRTACVGRLAGQILQPSLFLHLEPNRAGAIGRALSGLAHPTLLSVLERKPGHGIFNPDASTRFVRIASHIFSLHRQMDVGTAAPDGSVTAFPAPRRKRRAETPTAPQADAA